MASILSLNQSDLCDHISPFSENNCCNREALLGFRVMVSNADAGCGRGDL